MLICLQVSPQHKDIQTSTQQKPKPAARRRKGQRVLAVQHRGKQSSAKGGVCCGGTAASGCSQHQCRTTGTSILHYGMQRRNIRPLAMVGIGKKQNGATDVENCKRWQCPSSDTKNGPREDGVVPTPPPSSPLRDVTNAISTAVPSSDSVECRPTLCSAVGRGDERDKPSLAQPLHSRSPCMRLKGREDPSEYHFSLTEVTLLQLSQLSSQLPRPGTTAISPLLSSSPLPKAPSEKPSDPCLWYDGQPSSCQDGNRHEEAIAAQDRCTSDCTPMPFSNTTSTPLPMETPNPQQLHQVKVQEDCVSPEGLVVHGLAPAAVLPRLSGDEAAEGTRDGCDGPSITDSLADIMHGLDFDLSMSFQAMQISSGEWPGVTTSCTVRHCMSPLAH